MQYIISCTGKLIRFIDVWISWATSVELYDQLSLEISLGGYKDFLLWGFYNHIEFNTCE